MNFPKTHASDCLSSLPVFVNVNETLDSTGRKLERFNVSKITVIDEDFNVLGVILKSDIANFLKQKDATKTTMKNLLKNYSAKDVLNKNSKFVMAYPDSNLNEIYKIMNSLKTNYLPIVKSPWNKKLEGFIQLDHNYAQ